jgi:H2-forming N5,N10-methylenetetrahydromethanopterin dehydrogenase-like enzyme
LISSEVAGTGGTVVVVVVGMVVVVGGIVVVVVVRVMAGVVEFWTVKLTDGEEYARPFEL